MDRAYSPAQVVSLDRSFSAVQVSLDRAFSPARIFKVDRAFLAAQVASLDRAFSPAQVVLAFALLASGVSHQQPRVS